MTRRELRRENEELRALLGLSKPRTIEEWLYHPDGSGRQALVTQARGDRVGQRLNRVK